MDKNGVKTTLLNYKDAISNVNINFVLNHLEEGDYRNFVEGLQRLENSTKAFFALFCPELDLGELYKPSTKVTCTCYTGDEDSKEPYNLDDAFDETESGPSKYDLKRCILEELESTPSIVIGDIDINSIPEGATREDIEEDTISLFDFLLETLKALPEKEHAWIEGFLEDKSKYKAGNFVDAIKDTLIYDMVSRLKDGELVPIPYKVYPEIEEEIAKQFKNYMISYENGLCRLSILDDLKVK